MATVTDNFNRSNGAVGANWTQPPASAATLNVSSNKCAASVAGSTHCAGFWNADSFANDQYSQVTIGSPATTGSEAIGLIVRAKATPDDLYLAFITDSQYQLYKRIGGSYSLLTSAAGTSSSGNVIKLEALGSSPVVLNLYKNSVLQVTFTATGADIITGGSPGILISDAGHGLSVDDWQSDALTVTVTVNLTGVSAFPVVGTGTVTIVSAVVPPVETGGGGTGRGLRPRTGRRLQPAEDISVFMRGVAADPRIGQVVALNNVKRMFEKYLDPVRAQKTPEMPSGMRQVFKKVVPPVVYVYPNGLQARSAIGVGKVNAFYEDIDEETVMMIDLL